MRHRLVLLICLLLMNYGQDFAQDVNKKRNAKKITIGVIGKSESNPVFLAAYAGARVAAKEIGAKYGVEVVIDWQTPENENSQEQAQAVDQLSRSGAAG